MPKTKTKKIKGWAIIDRGEEIGRGERGRKYIYWDKKEALQLARYSNKHYFCKWKVVPCIITIKCPQKP